MLDFDQKVNVRIRKPQHTNVTRTTRLLDNAKPIFTSWATLAASARDIPNKMLLALCMMSIQLRFSFFVTMFGLAEQAILYLFS